MDPSLIALALILSSAVGVWALIKLWRRNIALGPTVVEPPPRRSDPMHAALHHSGLMRPGATALSVAPPLPADCPAGWSISVDGPVALGLVCSDAGLAAVGWPVAGDPARWSAAPQNRAACAQLDRFGGDLELQTTEDHAWLLRQHPTPPLAFDLLCQLAAAAWLATDPDKRDPPPLPGDLLPLSWVEGDWAYGELPPFGRLRVTQDALILQSASRLPRPDAAGGLPGPPSFRPIERTLVRAQTTVTDVTEAGAQLRWEGGVVQVKLLAGSMAQALAQIGLAQPPAEPGHAGEP